MFKIWPTNGFLKAKSYNLHFHKNDVTWPLSANGLLPHYVTFYFMLEFGVLLLSTLISQTGRLLKRAFRFGYIQHETLVQQVIKDRDVRLWKSIKGTSSHPLQDLLLPLKNRALRGRSHPYQILIKTTIQPLFISRKLNEDLKFRKVKPAIVNQQCLVYQF